MAETKRANGWLKKVLLCCCVVKNIGYMKAVLRHNTFRGNTGNIGDADMAQYNTIQLSLIFF